MEDRFSGRDIIKKPACPFCGMLIEKPRERMTRMPNEMPVGACSCGAAYACDVTGHNLGTAMIEALVFGCNSDWDLAWGLLPEEDYLEKLVENYDFETHLVIHGAVYEGRRTTGVLYFIRLQQDILEVTEKGTRKGLEKATAVPVRSSSRTGHKRSFTKKEVEALVNGFKIESLLTMAEQDKRIIRDIQRLLYSVDRLERWRAADALGAVSAVIAESDPGTISRLLQGLFTAVSDTSASSWGALDAIGEIIRNGPEQFAGYIPQLCQCTREKRFIKEALRALGRIGEKRPDLIRKITFQLIPFLQDSDPEIRCYAVILIGFLGVREARTVLNGMLDDLTAIEIYKDGMMETRTIGKLASEALKKG